MEVVGVYPPDVGLLGSERFLRLRLLGRGNVLIEDVLWLALGLRNLAVSASISLKMMDYSSKQISGGHRFD